MVVSRGFSDRGRLIGFLSLALERTMEDFPQGEERE
jgi:hypothetical protein